MRRRIIVRGIVQGVGMRPHVARVARATGVNGWCGNSDTEVFIEAEHPDPGVLDAFREQLLGTLPPLARVLDVREEELPAGPAAAGGSGAARDFRILPSRHVAGEKTLIPPDVAMCEDCAHDIADPANRRYRYPFTTCTNCGPRLSIIRALPYDRPSTTLDVFPLCADCAREYADPDDRRYHAQPISCPHCGPICWLETPPGAGDARTDGPFMELVARVRQAWDRGETVAVRGIGGFHLTCDAANPAAVARLRERKRRPAKPLALMVPDLATAREWGDLREPGVEELLTSPARPVVTVPAGPSALPHLGGIAPGLDSVGLMLPYSPLHALLVDRPIVATSGNLSGEPLCFTLDAAREQLAGLCDLFLMHDREIHVPVEDSVFVGTRPVRRSRGLAPVPVPLPEGPDVLAVGGELKNTFALAAGGWAHLSAHVGDMGSLSAQENYERAVEQLLSMRDVEPRLVVSDMHPGYSTTAWAQRWADRHGLELLQVQHHHAHALSLLAEHGLAGQLSARPAVVATLDGTGYGTDSTVWGGEVLTLRGGEFERSWHLPTFGLVGGDRAVREPWRLALGLAHACGRAADLVLPETPEARLVRSQLESGVGVVPTSSAGRLFDAAAYLLGALGPVCAEDPSGTAGPGGAGAAGGSRGTVTYEGEAAMRLEALARRGNYGPAARSYAEMIGRLFAPAPEGSAADRARQFHRDLAALVARELVEAARAAGTELVGLSGGSAANQILAADLRELLSAAGLELLEQEAIPAGDGGLSLGQAVAGRLLGARLERYA